MKSFVKVAALTPVVILMFLVDVPPQTPLQVQLVPEAQAIFGIWRRHIRRAAVVTTAAVATTATVATAAAASESAAAKQQAAAAQQQAAAAQQKAAAQQTAAAAPPPAAAAPRPAAPPAADGKPLPLGTVVPSLPAGCTSTPVGGVNYYYCGGNFYRAVFQGNQLVYVTAQP